MSIARGSTPGWRVIAARLGVVGLMALAVGAPVGAGTETQRPGWLHPEAALQETRARGIATVLVVTSGPGNEACETLRRRLAPAMAAHRVSRHALLAELSAADRPDRVAALGVTRFPTILVYDRDTSESSRVRLVDYRVGLSDPDAVARWLDALRLTTVAEASGSTPRRDAAVQTTQYGGSGVAPSAQAPAFVPSPIPAQVPVPGAVPMWSSAPAPAPVVVSPPLAPVVVTPPAQTIVIGPAPPPNVIYAVSGPAVMTAPTQLFLSPAPAPLLATPQQQGQPLGMNSPMPAAQTTPGSPPTYYLAPQPAGVTMSPTVAPSPVGTTVATLILTNPVFWDRVLGYMGQCLAKRGQPKVELAPLPMMVTTAGAPTLPGYWPAPGATATGPASLLYAPAPAPTPVLMPVTASPQQPMDSRGGWLHRLKGR